MNMHKVCSLLDSHVEERSRAAGEETKELSGRRGKDEKTSVIALSGWWGRYLVKAHFYYKCISIEGGEEEHGCCEFACSNALFAQMCYNICNKLFVMPCTSMHLSSSYTYNLTASASAVPAAKHTQAKKLPKKCVGVCISGIHAQESIVYVSEPHS